MTLKRTGDVKIEWTKPTFETAAIEFPSFAPNPTVDGGSFERHASNPLISVAVADPVDRILPTEAIEDPARSRILLLCHAKDESAARSHGREVFLFSAPWGHPEGPFTQLTAYDSPLIALGESGVDFDDGCIYGASGCIVGNTLYMAYHACNDDGSNAHGAATGGLLLGLASLDLSTGSYSATKLGQLQLGSSPYDGGQPNLRFINGKFHLLFTPSGPINPRIPRLYVSPYWSVTASDWTVHDMQAEFGDADVFDDAATNAMYLGDGEWYLSQYIGAAGIRGEVVQFKEKYVRHSRLAMILSPGDSGAWDDNNVDEGCLLYHQGTLYMYYAGMQAATQRSVGLATYAFNTQESQAGFSATDVEYRPYVDGNIVIGPTGNSYAAGGVQADFSTTNWAGFTPPHAFKSVDRVEIQNPFILAGTQAIMASCPSLSGTIAKFALARPTSAHNHTENTAGSYTQSATTNNSSAATGTEYGSTPGADLTIYYRVYGKPI